MAGGRKRSDWTRFFDAVHRDLVAVIVDQFTALPGPAAVADRVPAATHRRTISQALRTFAKAMDRGIEPEDHVAIERHLLTGGYLEAFPFRDIAMGYRIALRLIPDRVDNFFARRSEQRRAILRRALEDALFDNFARVATTRLELETRALQDSEERFRTMIEMAGDAISLADARTRKIVYANSHTGTLYGVAPDDLVGVAIEEFVPKRSRDLVRRRLTDALEVPIGQPWSVRRKLQRPNGETFDGALTCVRILGRGGVAQFLTVIRDVTEEVEQHQALRRYSRQMARINELGQALTSTFELDVILRRILKHTQEVVPCAAASLVLVQDGELVFHEALGPRGAAVKAIRMEAGQGLVGWVVEQGETARVADAKSDSRIDRTIEAKVKFPLRNVLCVPMRAEGRTLGAIEMLNRSRGPFSEQDVELAEAFAAFAAIALDKAMLFDERAALRQQLLQAEAARHAGRLASTIAQEMIDPLTILKNNLAICRNGSAGANDSRMEIMGEELERLHDIIRLLVDYSNATGEAPRPTPLPLLVADLATSLRPEMDAAGVALDVHHPKSLPDVLAVPHQVMVALRNLLRHAIHVTPAGESVHLKLRRRGGDVQVAVTDEGAPLTGAQIRTLFDPAAVQRGILAKGLDLYIASAIVRHQGSELHGRGHAHVGTTFSFTLPVSDVEDGAWRTR